MWGGRGLKWPTIDDVVYGPPLSMVLNWVSLNTYYNCFSALCVVNYLICKCVLSIPFVDHDVINVKSIFNPEIYVEKCKNEMFEH